MDPFQDFKNNFLSFASPCCHPWTKPTSSLSSLWPHPRVLISIQAQIEDSMVSTWSLDSFCCSFSLACPTATIDPHPASSWGRLPSAQADSWLLWWATPLLSVSVHHHGLVLSRSGTLLGRDEVLFQSPLQVLYSPKAHKMHAVDSGCWGWGDFSTRAVDRDPAH